MNFYKHFYCLSFILIYLRLGITLENNLKLSENSVLGRVSPQAVGLKFLVEVNNTSEEDYEVEISSDQCCLELNGVTDCESLDIVGRSSEVVGGGSSKVFTMVAPTVDPLQRKGYCILFIDSKPIDLERNTRDTIKINFDTVVKRHSNENIELPQNVTSCKKLDENPLSKCKPVNCRTYYNDKKPYYDTRVKRCTEVPTCVFDEYAKGPKVIYDPISNKCAVEKRLSKRDIDVLKTVVENNRKPKDIIIFDSKGKNNDIEKKPSLTYTTERREAKTSFDCDDIKTKSNKKESKIRKFKNFIKNHKNNAIGVVLLLLTQCCLVWCIIKCCCTMCSCKKRNEDKKIVQSFYNYKRDASVTTPLIYTSNMDTETSECQYISESSLEIDQKIKRYKSLQKVKHMKSSLSDDILSKCMNRRDWNRKPARYEAIQELQSHCFDEILAMKAQCNKSRKQESKKSEGTFNIENEKSSKSSKSNKKSDTNAKSKHYVDSYNNTSTKSSGISGEKEIKTHDYDDVCQKTEYYSYNAEDKAEYGLATEKGAQAFFPNDSIDDLLSERGVVFMSDDNMSKDSFFNDSNEHNESIGSSRTSKNDLVKDVLSSILSKKSKTGPCSEPGGFKLLHMSHASIHYSSSNNELDCYNDFKKTSGSRVSL